MYWAPGAQLCPFTLVPSRPVSTPTGPHLSSLSISTSGAWVQSGLPARIQTVGKRLVGLSLKHCGDYARLGRHILVGSVFLKTTLCSYLGAQEKSKHSREKCQVCGALFSRRDAAMKFTCTLTRGGGAQVRTADCCGRSFHSSLKYAHSPGLQVWTQVSSNDKNSNSRNTGKCPSEELQMDLASMDRRRQRSELGRRPQCNPGPLSTTPEGALFFPLKRAPPPKAEPLWPPAFSSVCGSGRFITFSRLHFLSPSLRPATSCP